MVAEIFDPPHPKFMDFMFAKLPAPVHWETGEPMWERGVRFHGSQLSVMKSKARYTQTRGGVRAGKSFVVAAKEAIDILWGWERGRFDSLYWNIGPSYALAQEEMNHVDWMLNGWEIPHEFHTPKDSAWSITFPNVKTLVETKTGTEAARIAGKACRLVLLCEANQMGYEVWRNAKERVLQTRGGVLVNGTFENESGGTWFRGMANDWPRLGAAAEGQSFPLPTWDNRVFFPGGRTDPAILGAEKDLTPAEFMERYGGEPARSSVLVFPQADRNYHIQHRFPHLGSSFDPEQRVVLFSDPGAAHAYAVLAVQFWNNVVWVIDAIYRWDRTATQVIAECADRPWAANVDTHVMDFAARQRRAEGAPVVEQWVTEWEKRVKRNVWYITEQVPLHPGYERHKKALLNGWPEDAAQHQFNPDNYLKSRVTDPAGPRVMFAPEAAAPFFGGMVDGRQFSGEYTLHRNRKNAVGTVTSDDPIDLDNDAIKALNYGLYWHFGPADNRPDLYRFIQSGQEIPFEMALG